MRNLQLNVEDSLSKDTKLWRYIDLAKFVSLLDSGALWLARSDTFRDQSEGRFPSEMRVAIEKAYQSFEDKADSPINSADDFQEYLCRNAYLSCWHKNIDENMVMWELYGRDSNAVAVQTTVEKLESNISKIKSGGLEFHLKNVLYERAEDVKGELNYSAPFFIKRPHFSFEQEARIFLSTYSTVCPNKDTPLGVLVDLNVVEAIEEILVHPDSEEWFVKVVQSISDKYGLRAPVKRGAYGNKF
ncbi:DUF2971 domain-containing protein [Tenacibaculum sp. KUL113]|nr:DUF2971 domain-containing protein [Tenacibaculum sp. KUL113]